MGCAPYLVGAILLLLWPAVDPALVEPPKLGQRKVRIVGIDAPEVHGRCAEETRLAEAATARLQALLNGGPFEMRGRIGDTRDRYGRDLRTLTRKRADGSVQSIAADMRDSGLAHRYVGYKTGWC